MLRRLGCIFSGGMMIKKIAKGIGIGVGAVVLVVAGYVGYLFASYHRVPDDQPLKVDQAAAVETLKSGQTYRAMTYNIGYGSYPPSYSFFMDGGKFSRAYSAAAVRRSLAGVVKTTQQVAPDVAFYQEVDRDGDRSRHVNEVALLAKGQPNSDLVFAQNYDSAYLFFPVTQPIGAAKSGLVTTSRAKISAARRYQLPVDTDYNKLMDLDRAFSMSTVPVANGKSLILVNVHLSAFTPNQAVQQAQFAKLFKYIVAAYADGNYVMVGGDYNHRVIKNAPAVFHTSTKPQTWTHPFPVNQLPAGFYQPTKGLAAAAVPSARGLDKPWSPKTSFKTLIDGFILSPNIEAKQVQVIDTGFKYSDHNPVELRFTLK